MEGSNFFKNVWRFNAVVIMAGGVLAIGLALVASFMVYKDATRDRSARNIVNIEETTEKEEVWKLGYMTKIRGSSVVMVPLDSDQAYSRGSYSKSTSSARNYLFIDSQSNDKHWLFNHNSNLITHTKQLPDTSYGEEDKAATAIMYTVVKNDTNGDDLLTKADSQTLALSKADGTSYTEVLKDIDHVIGHRATGADTVLTIYQRNNVGYSATINLSNFSVTNEEQLPRVQP